MEEMDFGEVDRDREGRVIRELVVRKGWMYVKYVLLMGREKWEEHEDKGGKKGLKGG